MPNTRLRQEDPEDWNNRIPHSAHLYGLAFNRWLKAGSPDEPDDYATQVRENTLRRMLKDRHVKPSQW